jgi:hypothetical protein
MRNCNPQQCCGGQWVDVNTNANCGSCGNACDYTHQHCEFTQQCDQAGDCVGLPSCVEGKPYCPANDFCLQQSQCNPNAPNVTAICSMLGVDCSQCSPTILRCGEFGLSCLVKWGASHCNPHQP